MFMPPLSELLFSGRVLRREKGSVAAEEKEMVIGDACERLLF